MTEPEHNPDYPRAILHIDGDSFFVSCELTRRPHLKGTPVVTGFERGIATAMSREAKALGIHRGMRIRDIRRLYPQTTILPSDYRMYSLYAKRMYSIVRKHAVTVEEYSIDECFADLTGLAKPGATYQDIARTIQAELHESLGITFSVGLGVNKSTAKIASKWQKPAGITFMPKGKIREYLKDLPIGSVWGIGRSTTLLMGKLGIRTALDLALKDRAWVAEHCDRPVAEIYEEFQGSFVKGFEPGGDPSSIQHTRSFHPASGDRAFLWSQLSHHAEEAAERLRSKGLFASRASFFVKTLDFQYIGGEVGFAEPLSEPDGILRAMKPRFESIWRSGLKYRAAGISLMGLRRVEDLTQTLFDEPRKVGASRKIYDVVDLLARKFGGRALFLGSSFKALQAERADTSFEARQRQFDLIFLGEVR